VTASDFLLASSTTGTAAGFADPVLSASVYCSGRLSEVIHRAVAPFWEEFKRRDVSDVSYIWVMRYAKCGDHLKIRLHGLKSQRQLMSSLLSQALERYLHSLGPRDPDSQQKSTDFSTPIDQDDFAAENYPDHGYRWTHYLRSPVSLGFIPYLLDDRYVSLLTLCLARSTEILFGRLKTDADGQISHTETQSILLRALITGLSSLPLTQQQRWLYLSYHRDWLLRALLKQPGGSGGPRKLEQLLHRFDEEAAKPGAAVGRLARLARTHWESDQEKECEPDLAAWGGALRHLARYVESVGSAPSHQVDPFAELPVFPPLFKAIHGLANQLGLRHLDEAFAHHLLLAAIAPSELRDRPVRLVPALERSGFPLAQD
jgi:hypothetical protein